MQGHAHALLLRPDMDEAVFTHRESREIQGRMAIADPARDFPRTVRPPPALVVDQNAFLHDLPSRASPCTTGLGSGQTAYPHTRRTATQSRVFLGWHPSSFWVRDHGLWP